MRRRFASPFQVPTMTIPLSTSRHDDPVLDFPAMACRVAGLAFLNGVTAGWTKADLAAWLAGPYRAVTRPVELVVRHDTPRLATTDVATRASDPSGLARLDEVICEARWRVLAALESAAMSRGRVAFAARARTLGHVRCVVDADGRSTWVALDARGMRLRDRVLALFAVDCLAHPLDYERELIVCHRCERVFFDASARGRGECPAHRPH